MSNRPRRARIALLAALSIVLAPPLARALPPDRDVDHYILEHWDGSDGLPQNSVNGVIQDDTGYLWLASFDGLVRFDGVRFERMPDDNLPGRRLRIVGHDDNGFWIGGEHGGLSHHDGRGPRPVDLARHGIGGSVSHVLRHGADLWIATHEGLYRLRDGDVIERFERAAGIPERGAWRIAIGADGSLFVATPDGLLVRPAGSGALRKVGYEPLEGTMVYDLLVEDGRLWIGSERGLFLRTNSGEYSARWIPAEPDNRRSVRTLTLDDHGNLWAGAWGEGLVRVNEQGSQKLTRADGLSSTRLTALHEDREGSLWFGTDGGGLGRLRDATVTSHGGPDWGLASSSVTSVTEHPDDGFWLGLNCEGVAHFDGELRAVHGRASGLRNDCIFTLLVDDRERLWAGSFGSGIYRMEGETFVPLPVPRGYRRLLALYQRGDGRILAGSDSGLLRHDADRDRFVTVEALAGRNVRFITEGGDGTLWLATREGALHGDIESGFERLTHPDLTELRAIHVRANGTVWLGSYGKGLFRYRDGRLFRFTGEHGLPEQVVSRIIEDGRGHLWLTGNRGIHGVALDRANAVADGRRETLDVLSLGRTDGMRTIETSGGSQPAGTRAENGRIWVPTIDGIAAFDPARTRRNELPPPVVIERVLVDGRERRVDEPVVVGADMRSLEIHYTGLSLLVPDRVAFRYRLDADAPWQEAGNRRVAYFSSLPPGDHDFQVIAANNDGVWNATGARLRLVARAAFHQTIWFPALIALAAMLALSALFVLRMRQGRQRETRLSGLVQQRTRELERANDRLERLARIDELTGIPNRRHLEETLSREWRRARRRNEPLALLMIDIDDFKAYNDRYGHPAGDACLQRVAEALNECLGRGHDFLGRYGGEELLGILPDTDLEGARTLARNMREAVRSLDITHADSASGRISVSIGLTAGFPREEGPEPSGCLGRADAALYRAKREGRDRIESA